MDTRFVVVLSTLLILISSVGVGAAAEIIVHNGESIQAAVNSGGNGSVIILEPGTYNQNVTINSDLYDITIKSSTGNPDDVIIQVTEVYGFTFFIEHESGPITFKGITIKGVGDDAYAIYGFDAYSVTVENCKIINQNCGVVSGMVGTIDIINTIFINCKSGIGVGEFVAISGRDNTFIDCGEIVSRAEDDMATVELTNSKIINTKDQPPANNATPVDDPVEPTVPVSEPTEPVSNPTPVETPIETPVEDTGSSSGGSSHSSSSGSSGGGGGSPEPASNVQVKDTSKVFIQNDKPVTFNFTNHVTTVESISFTSKKTMGKTTAITEDLKEKSTIVPDLPEGLVYKSFNVWVGNAGYGSSDNILNASVSFRVDKSWMQENDITSVSLYEYDKEWVKLQTTQVSEDEEFLYFTADVKGFSSFVIIGKSTQRVQEEDEKITAENRAVGDIQEGSETEEAESNPKGNTLLSIGIVTGALLVGAFILKSMKK
ncbi:PGF-pre-PGF domain-containing protein [Methanosarcina sp. 1.H.A.2.2]|uniref:PGF-pre-PGF domain-containing protein n=1 Tax=Methanosarcina sp. 1.H.A.2.2 TaxID=1483601 RepID=UPI0006221A6A|nr:PGF-pre-PGF domain-containing protein [Methanosarcina sp. 1.H.A.2.2]KKH50164.1 hypothetical protein EO93_04400 [Methanosarcina sp. 1.H.A.2.2]